MSDRKSIPRTEVPDSLKAYRKETHDMKLGDKVKVGANVFVFYCWQKDGRPRFLSKLAFERWRNNNLRGQRRRYYKKKSELV